MYLQIYIYISVYTVSSRWRPSASWYKTNWDQYVPRWRLDIVSCRIQEIIYMWLTPQHRGIRQTEGNRKGEHRRDQPSDHMLADSSAMTWGSHSNIYYLCSPHPNDIVGAVILYLTCSFHLPLYATPPTIYVWTSQAVWITNVVVTCHVHLLASIKVGITRIQHGLHKHFDLFVKLATP